jgi:hypothetical protein
LLLGYADDAVIIAIVLRSRVKHAGAGALARHSMIWNPWEVPPVSPHTAPLLDRIHRS